MRMQNPGSANRLQIMATAGLVLAALALTVLHKESK